MTIRLKVIALCLWLFTITMGGYAYGDDVDVYMSRYQSDSLGGQPQVMIIFDNSASMTAKVANSSDSRLAVAKSVIIKIIEDNPKLNFALTVFNDNYDVQSGVNKNNGGRIVQGFPSEKTQDETGDHGRLALQNVVNSLQATTTTPLCETMYEVYRYFSGDSVWFGDDKKAKDQPDRDTTIETNGVYESPLRSCENIYVIYMTDGQPNKDIDANSKIKSLVASSTCGNYEADNDGNSENCLPQLTEYMRTHDLAPDLAGDQHAYTYTIGFATDQQLLKDAASPLLDEEGEETDTKGYFTADDVSQLSTAFNNIVANILSQSRTLVSSELTAANVTQTRSLDYVYLPRFLPQEDQQWTGNIKKYVYDSEAGERTGSELWSGASDDDEVESGGFGAQLLTQGYLGRDVYTDILSANRIVSLSTYLPTISSSGARGDADQYFGSPAATLLKSTQYAPVDVANWVLGKDVIGGSGGTRDWLVGDIIHSTPIAINYGGDSDSNVRLFFGTNEGILHAVNASTGQESWAFWPEETVDTPVYRMLNGNEQYRAYDLESGEKIYESAQSINYGLDGELGYITVDSDKSGVIGDANDDRALIAFGFRRGGYSYYGLDVTKKDGPPAWAWRITPQTAGFATLGQTWSTPIPAKLESSKAVFTFGGGYDIAKDDLDAIQDDSRGTGVYIVDAYSGDLIGGFAATTGSDKLNATSELKDSVSGNLNLVDLDLNDLSDHAFFADTGGNVWYADISNTDASQWSLTKLATLGRHLSDGQDRRFFNTPDLVRTTIGGQKFDFLMIGSGDRAHPGRTEISNYLFILNVTSVLSGAEGAQAISFDDLSEATFDAESESGTLSFPAAARTSKTALASFSGWKLAIGEAGSGRKVLSNTQTVTGTTFFTAYEPSASICTPIDGVSYFYAFQFPQITWQGSEAKETAGQIAAVELTSDYMVGTPSLHVSNGSVQILGINSSVLQQVLTAVTGSESLSFSQQNIQPSWWYQEK
ncbi:VWA domain-containing protein [Phytohalomonas tamaricis]|uniref:VWA domain-containing protein n=1 Tax=Phytohalomonas tamaricis TaxID=2081032 RepID=UPI000D0B7893|nr:hypothetical protein [Phytohalomonas tamaricis]